MKLAAWLVPCRSAVRDTPRYRAPIPSSLTTVNRACGALRYFGASRGSARLWCCACKRIFTTSIGFTTNTASVTPAARPAERTHALALPQESSAGAGLLTEEGRLARDSSGLLVCKQLLVPLIGGKPNGHLRNDSSQHSSKTLVKTQCGLTLHDLYTGGNETARFYLENMSQLTNSNVNSWTSVSPTPGALALFDSCIRTLIVSKDIVSTFSSKIQGLELSYREGGRREPPSYQHLHQLFSRVSTAVELLGQYELYLSSWWPPKRASCHFDSFQTFCFRISRPAILMRPFSLSCPRLSSQMQCQISFRQS